MLRRQFLIGIAAVAILPASASARRRRSFIVIPMNDNPETRKTQVWIGVGVVGIMALVAIGRAVFWVLNRLEENPAPSVRQAPSYPVAGPQAVARPVVVARKTSGPASFGRRGR